MDINKALQDYGLTPEQYEQCLKDASNKVERLIDLDWSDIIEKYGLSIHYDTLRKASQTIFGGAFVYEYFQQKNANKASTDVAEDYIGELNDKLIELEKSKVRFRDQRNDFNRQLRAEARIEENLEMLERKLETSGEVKFKVDSVSEIDYGEKDVPMVVMLSDLHIGAEFDSVFGRFDSDIAKMRLEEYLNRIISIQNLHRCNSCHIVLLGDLISGAIHRSIAITNREDVIEQIELASELLASFICEICKRFPDVKVCSVSGNHSRINKKDDALKDERLDRIIDWYLESSLSHIKHLQFIKSSDTTFTAFNINDKIYVAVHGDYDAFSEAGIGRLTLSLGFKPYAVLYAHKHTPAGQELFGIKMIQGGTLAGSGDDYTVQKRLSGNASQTVLVCDENGTISARYDVGFSI